VITKNTNNVKFSINNLEKNFNSESFRINHKFKNDARIKIEMVNSQSKKVDSSGFYISVAKDAFPSIHVEEVKDSVSDAIRFFSGSIADDYGFSSLKFVYTIISENGKRKTQTLPVTKVLGTEMPFNFAVDFKHENVKLKDKIEDKLEDVQQSSEDMKKQLDRSLEMLKKLQVNEKIDDIEKELKELAKDQEELKEQTENDKLSSEMAKEKQDDLNKKFDELKQDLEQLK